MDKNQAINKTDNIPSDTNNQETKSNGKLNSNNKGNKKNNHKPKNNKRGNTPKDVPDHNDYKFYAATDEIARDIASIPFNVMNGADFPVQGEYVGSTGTKIVSQPRPLPGIMTIEYIPSVGINQYRTDGINMAAVQLYTKVRQANSGAKNYEAPDLTMLVLALKDIYAQFFEIRRVIGVSTCYNYYNHNMPDLIISSLGVNPADLRANLAKYRGQLNLLAEKINSFAVPKYFKAFLRQAYIASNIFMDSDSIRGQMYVMKRSGYYKFNPTLFETGTALEFTAFDNSTLHNLSYYIDILEEMLDALYLDTDALTMSGDILKAFGEGGLYTVSQIGLDYAVVPVFDMDILSQIHNSTSLDVLYNSSSSSVEYRGLHIFQENQLIKFLPNVVSTSARTNDFQFYNVVLNSHKDNPDYKDVLEWTRMQITTNTEFITENDITKTRKNVTSCGLEIVISYNMYRYTPNNNILSQKVYQYIPSYQLTAERGVSISDLEQFDWHPMVYIVNHQEDDPEETDIHVAADLKVATVIPYSSLKTMNDSACYSAYYGTMYQDSKVNNNNNK